MPKTSGNISVEGFCYVFAGDGDKSNPVVHLRHAEVDRYLNGSNPEEPVTNTDLLLII